MGLRGPARAPAGDGVDAAGRKQYLYHERWRAHRDRRKFDSMVAFGERLPRLRRRVGADLRPANPARAALPPASRAGW